MPLALFPTLVFLLRPPVFLRQLMSFLTSPSVLPFSFAPGLSATSPSSTLSPPILVLASLWTLGPPTFTSTNKSTGAIAVRIPKHDTAYLEILRCLSDNRPSFPTISPPPCSSSRGGLPIPFSLASLCGFLPGVFPSPVVSPSPPLPVFPPTFLFVH